VAADPYPPAPWRIAGPAAIVPSLVPLAAARAHLPADVAAVPVAPGHTLGGLLLARYEGPSTLHYGELLVLPALTRVAGSVGWWISHAYVDSPASLAGGRRMWGVPKDLATFAWGDGGGVTIVREDGVPVLGAAWRTPARTAALPGLVTNNGTTGGADRRRFTGRGTLDVAPARARVDVPAGSPLAGLPLGGRRIALAGRADLRLRAPRVLA
jgi:acetoacetate decarboxylase